uniref:Ubiquitin conjugating enzyme E2 U n=1 Tax=Leptobrachium leishanense TaxID=445787 RepID=A0A8C5PT16_9ANUR
MHSRAYLLLEREYQQLQEDALYGISVTPRTDTLLDWVAEIRGLKDSLWEGCVLQLYMKYPENYNHLPPEIVFNTIPFHPNVDQISGKPCIIFLDNPEYWNPRYTMTTILLTAQVMICNPQAESAVNLEAADLWQNRPSMYRQLVLDCVKNSKLIDAGFIHKPPRISTAQDPPLPSAGRKIKPVSFEDYHRNWTEIGTSKAAEDLKSRRHKGPPCETPSGRANGRVDLIKLYRSSIHGSFNSGTSLPRLSVPRGSPECIMCRLSDMSYADPEARLLVTDPEARLLVTDPEARLLVTDPEARSLVTDPEARSLVTDPEARSLVTDPEARSLVTDPEARLLVKDPEARLLVTDPEARLLVTDPEARSLVTDPDVDSEPYYHRETSHRDTGRSAEPLEEEVENLVAWTNTLKMDLLED